MSNINQMLKSFYSNYNFNAIETLYHKSLNQSIFANFYKNLPFTASILMEDKTFKMKFEPDGLLSMELMVVIGYFFDNYSDDSGCVWTSDEKKIVKFFFDGISKFSEFGGKIIFNLDDNAVYYLVLLLTSHLENVTDLVIDKLCKQFKSLETIHFLKLFEKVKKEAEKEEALKHVEEVTCMDIPTDWSNVFACDEKAQGVFCETIADGLVLSLNNLGRVDIEYISQITGANLKTVILELSGSIYQNPATWGECFYKGFETADEYLSGNVVEKLKIAKTENKKYHGYFTKNVKALEAVIPHHVSTEDIYITIGSPWVPSDVIDDFMTHLFGDWARGYGNKINRSLYATIHDETSGTWEIPLKARYARNFANETTFGTRRITGVQILEKTLNMQTIQITDEYKSGNTKKRVTNKSETILAVEKQKKLIDEFKKWIWNDEKRKKRLIEIYDSKYCSKIIRQYDGSFLTFPDMNKDVNLFDYQKNAVARIMFSPNTLLSHDVGAGKTFVMAAAGMEMRRIGTSKKNLYVVPNNLVGQWGSIFKELYPNANLLLVTPNNFTISKRKTVLEQIRDKEFDGIIMAYSCFDMIPVSKEFLATEIKDKITELNKLSKQKNKAVSNIDKKIEKLKKSLDKLESDYNKVKDLLNFDELKINTIFLDEAHNYKNVPIETKISRVLGLSTTGSNKCLDMLNKVHIVQKQNGGRGAVFATGTPITNSLTDIFVMQKYLQSAELNILDLQSFDSWIGMFAERETDFEIDVDTNNYRMATRFSKYHNMPELAVILSQVTDFYQVSLLNDIPLHDGYKDILIPKTNDFKSYLQLISKRADDVRNHLVRRTEDNMLKITTDGRKAALDLRLVNEYLPFTYSSKVAHCAENVYDIYLKTTSSRSTQLIFCDTSTPKSGFNLYDELKRLLVMMGVNADEIAFVHDATTETKRNKLFENVRRGNIRILIGSTFKLGIGVNVQDKLIALHHLDIPWRPADMVQREGRILRKGNQNKKVVIYRYITEGSFDAYSWQLLESKQRMIRSILSGAMPSRMCQEVDDTVLNYAEVKALAIGNPLLKKRVEIANELSRNLTLQRKHIETVQALQIELLELPEKIKRQKTYISNCKKDADFYKESKVELSKEERKNLRSYIYNELVKNELLTEELKIGSYQGFDIIIPTNMTFQKPYLYLKHIEKYTIEMGSTENGIMVRLDNFLEGFKDLLKEQKDKLKALNNREIAINEELEKKDGYIEIIQKLKNELKEIDIKLGVKK